MIDENHTLLKLMASLQLVIIECQLLAQESGIPEEVIINATSESDKE